MEVKDINSIAAFQGMKGKVAAGGFVGQVVGNGFADLVGQTADLLFDGKVEAPFSDEKTSTLDVKKTNVVEKDRRIKKQAVAEKDCPTDGRSKKVADKKSTDESVVVSQGVEKTDVVAKSAEKKVGEQEAEVAVEGAVASNELPFSGALEYEVDGKVSASQVSVESKEASADLFLNILPEQQRVIVSEEAGKSVNSETFVSSSLCVDVPESCEVVDFDGFISKSENDEAALLQPLNWDANEEADGVELAAADVLLGQAKALDAKLDKEYKLSVEVSVNEEDFSFVDASEVVQDSVTSAKLVEAEADAKAEIKVEVKDSKIGDEVLSVASSQTIQLDNKPISQMQNPLMVAALANFDEQGGADVAKFVVSEAASSVGGVSRGALSASAGTQAEIPFAVKENDTSFRDVFKGMSKEVVEQVKVNITKSAVKGVDSIEIRLKPEDLGNIEIKMQISKDGKLQAHIVASRSETVEILQKDIQSLEKAFNDAGFELEDGALSFSFREGGESNREQEDASGLRNFIGKALESEGADDVVGNDNQMWSSAQGLNIRV